MGVSEDGSEITGERLAVAGSGGGGGTGLDGSEGNRLRQYGR